MTNMRYVSVFCCSVFVMISFSSAHFFLKQGTIASCLKNTNVLHYLHFFALPSPLPLSISFPSNFNTRISNKACITDSKVNQTGWCYDIIQNYFQSMSTATFAMNLNSLNVRSCQMLSHHKVGISCLICHRWEESDQKPTSQPANQPKQVNNQPTEIELRKVLADHFSGPLSLSHCWSWV